MFCTLSEEMTLGGGDAMLKDKLCWLDGQMSNANLALVHTGDSPHLKRPGISRNDCLQIIIYSFGTHILKPENDYTRERRSSSSQQITKIEVMCEKNAAFVTGFLKDCRIFKTVKTLLMQMHCIMSLGS